MKRRAALGACLAAIAAVVAIAVAPAARRASGPKPALVTIRNLTATSAIGSYCTLRRTSDGHFVQGCADAGYPLHPRGRLPAPPGAVVRANVRKRARSVSAHLVRRQGEHFEFVGPSLPATPAGSGRRTWTLRLPNDLEHATDLDLFVDYAPGSDADFWAGVRPVEHWP